ncbi:MAG: ATP-dependent helicase [Chloroflexi bacterium]|nr:ATP-dependent helicase [Chloroflexota bacterium]
MTQALFKFRESQWDIINYSRGLVGVSAVPGSGKTFTLSHLAAQLVQRLHSRSLKQSREVLIVTFTNSAVNSFKSRIADILERERGLLPYTGYRVRTLHGLAHDIVRERPTLVGLHEDFRIVDERVALAIQSEAITAQMAEWAPRLESWLSDDISEDRRRQILARDLGFLLERLVPRFISHAKANRRTPSDLLRAFSMATDPAFDLALFCIEVYRDYQRSLAYRGAVDFDDLVRLAIDALSQDERYLNRLRERWPYVLEDEAQDSSRLQQEMLELLSAGKNWVRVGDPNQAINTTFTTAELKYLRNFLARDDVKERPLHTSGRSSRKIIGLANELVRWTTKEHPIIPLRQAFIFQEIEPTEPGDVQVNPPDAMSNIYIHPADKNLTPDDELAMVVTNLSKWLPENPDRTVAVLVPENNRGFLLARQLDELGLEYEELLRSTSETRAAARLLSTVLRFIANPATPSSSGHLATLYREVWLPYLSVLASGEDTDVPEQIEKFLRRLTNVEDLIWPVEADLPGRAALPELWQDDLDDFVRMTRRWLAATSLPIDQLILTIGNDLFIDPPDIALAYKIAVVLKSIARDHPDYRLAEFVQELNEISNNQRRFLGFDDSESGYEPRPGVITISTMHAAKGLEWDRVYLMSVNNYSFPSALDTEEYIGEKWFIRDNLNLEAEAIAQLEHLITHDMSAYELGQPSRKDRLASAAERLRLLYVGITRARSELIITWNIGRYWHQGGEKVKRPALPLIHLMEAVDG